MAVWLILCGPPPAPDPTGAALLAWHRDALCVPQLHSAPQNAATTDIRRSEWSQKQGLYILGRDRARRDPSDAAFAPTVLDGVAMAAPPARTRLASFIGNVAEPPAGLQPLERPSG